MSTRIEPRPNIGVRPVSRAATRPGPARPTQPRPFRWSRGSHSPAPPRSARSTIPASVSLRPDLPDPARWAATLAGAVVEVITGARQAPQLRRWVLPELYSALTGLHLTPCARGTRPIHVRTCALDAHKTEAAVIVATASRIYALALRLEEHRGRWMMTALELA